MSSEAPAQGREHGGVTPASPRLVVFSPNWLGDAVMALPAIEDLRRHLHAHLTVVARGSVARLFRLVPQVGEVIELEWRGRVADMGAMRRDIGRLRTMNGSIALLLPNSFASAWLAFAARIPQRWGYARDGRSFLLTRPIQGRRVQGDPAHKLQGDPAYKLQGDPGYKSTIHQGASYQHLVHELGAANGPLEPRVVVPPGLLEEGRTLLASAGWDGARPLVVFAPGAAYGTAKQWWPTHYAQLASDLVSMLGAHVALVGSRGDAEKTGEVMGLLPPPARSAVIDLAGRTTLEQLAAVLSLARVCVSNDSGAMHLAAAVGTPLAALFGPTNEHETRPLAHAPTELLIEPVACRPCMLRECPIDHPCMRDLTPARVLTSVTRLLGRSDDGAQRTMWQAAR